MRSRLLPFLPLRSAGRLLLVGLAACVAAACSRAGTPGATSNATSGDAGYVDAAGSADAEADVGAAADASGDAAAVDAGPTDLRVLFIGNSYTYVNDLPGMLSKIAATAGAPPTITTDEVVQGGATLEVQWQNGLAQPKIAAGNWTHVVLQGGSEEALASTLGPPDSFFDYADQFGDLIAKAGAKPTLFVTWARAAGDSIYAPLPEGSLVCPAQMQAEVDLGYASVAKLWPDSILVCAGDAFQRAIAQHPEIALQQSDLSHPTVAGTYLAASTFYVALTGKSVPAQSAVPAGLSAEDAAALRAIANVGLQCASPVLQGAVASDVAEDVDGGPPLDFGTTTLPVTNQIQLQNTGGMTVGIRDGMSLAPPFEWTSGGAYPGGSGPGFCASSLSPGESCVLSVTFTGASSGNGKLTLDFTNDYLPTAIWALSATAPDRAYLVVSDTPGPSGCTDACGPNTIDSSPGSTATVDLYVMNQGALPVTALDVGAPLAPPFAWAGGAFPGGQGSAADGGTSGATVPYCSAGALGVGEQCMVTVTFSSPTIGTYTSAVNLTYSDAMGPVLPNANRNLKGDCSRPLPP